MYAKADEHHFQKIWSTATIVWHKRIPFHSKMNSHSFHTKVSLKFIIIFPHLFYLLYANISNCLIPVFASKLFYCSPTCKWKYKWTLHNDRLSIKSLIPRLSHRLSYVTFRTVSWSWNSSPTISWPVGCASVYIIHMYPMCVTQNAARGTVEIRMTNGCAQLKRNHDLISVLHHVMYVPTALGCATELA